MDELIELDHGDDKLCGFKDAGAKFKAKGNRRWPDEVKAKIVEESNQLGASVPQVAARYGVAKSCLYAWRQKAIESKLNVANPKNEARAFAPLVVEDDNANGVDYYSSSFEIPIEGVEIKIGNVSLSFKQATLEQISTLVKRLNGVV